MSEFHQLVGIIGFVVHSSDQCYLVFRLAEVIPFYYFTFGITVTVYIACELNLTFHFSCYKM